MTLEEKAEEYARKECCATCLNINHFCKEKCECWEFAKKGYLAGVKESEKENAELKEQIEKMKCCYNCEHYTWNMSNEKCQFRCESLKACVNWKFKE